jgi:hypothetical protein
MKELTFEFQAVGRSECRTIAVRDLVIAGWTGRDQHKVQEHIEELRQLGVAPPPSTPCFYRAGVELLTTSAQIDCLGTESSGEAEYFLLVDQGGAWWIGVGSDHTDRKVESYSITVSKQMCPKPIGTTVWRFEDVADHWDGLEIRSWVSEGEARVLYQEGSIAAMRDPRDTVSSYRQAGCDLTPGTIMFGGTLPVLGGIRAHRRFEMELRDPVRDRAIRHAYTARWLEP